MAETAAKIPQFLEDMKRQGDTERAKSDLLKAGRSYYRAYHDKGGGTNFIARIEQAAQKYPQVAAEISRMTE